MECETKGHQFPGDKLRRNSKFQECEELKHA